MVFLNITRSEWRWEECLSNEWKREEGITHEHEFTQTWPPRNPHMFQVLSTRAANVINLLSIAQQGFPSPLGLGATPIVRGKSSTKHSSLWSLEGYCSVVEGTVTFPILREEGGSACCGFG